MAADVAGDGAVCIPSARVAKWIHVGAMISFAIASSLAGCRRRVADTSIGPRLCHGLKQDPPKAKPRKGQAKVFQDSWSRIGSVGAWNACRQEI